MQLQRPSLPRLRASPHSARAAGAPTPYRYRSRRQRRGMLAACPCRQGLSLSLDSDILSEESSSPEPPEANANPKLHQPRNANPKLHQQEERQFEASSALQPPSELSRGLSGLTGAAGRRPRVIHEPAGGPGLSSASTSSPPAAESTSDDHGPRKLRLLRAELLNEAAEGRHSKKLPRGSAQRAPPSSKRRAAGVPSPSPHVHKHHRSAM